MEKRGLQSLNLSHGAAMCALGEDPGFIWRVLLAGISSQEESIVSNRHFEPMIMTHIPEQALTPLKDSLRQLGLTWRQRRCLQIAAPSLQKLAEGAELTSPITLLLAGPEQLQGLSATLTSGFLKNLSIQSNVEIDLKNSRTFALGRSGGFDALDMAFHILDAGIVNEVVVGGVDSHFDARLLCALDAESRIKGAGCSDGFAPGEASAFVLLTRKESNGLKLARPGIGRETGHRYSSEPYLGEGLHSTIKNLYNVNSFTQTPLINTIVSSYNGESFFSKEWGVAAIRNKRYFAEGYNFMHPSDCFGDVGAAFGPLVLALLNEGKKTGSAKFPALALASSEMESRSAVLTW